MKRHKNWNSEPKQGVNLSLTKTAVKLLEQQAHQRGMSKSELVERYARSFQQELSLPLPQTEAQLELPPLNSESEQRVEEPTQDGRQAELLSLLDALLAAAPVGICFLDQQLRYLRINPVLASINGLSIEAHLGRKFCEVLPEMAAQYEPQLQQVLETGEPILNLEISGEAPGEPGKYGYWLGNYYPVPDANGQTVGVGMIWVDITAIKQVEAALHNSEALARARAEELQAFMNVVPVAVWVADDPGCHRMTANRAAYELMRAKPGTAATATPADGVYPFNFKLRRNGQEIPVGELSMQKAGRTGQEVIEEAELVFEDGVVRHLYGRAVPLRDEQGNVRGVLGAYLDISDRKQLEEELRRRERQFKTLAENAPDIISRVDAQLRHLYMSPAIETATGIPPEAFIGKTNAELGMPKAFYSRWHESIRQVLLAGHRDAIEFELPTPDGTRYYQSRLVPELAADGSVESVLSIARDVTEYKQVEQALRQSEACFRRIFESKMLGLGFFHIDGTITEANDALLNLLGYTREEFLAQGLSWKAMTPPEYAALDEQAYQETLEQGYCTPYEKELICKDGSRIPVLGGGGHFANTHESGVFYIIDQTSCKRAEQAQQEAEERLRVAVKNSPMSVFNQDRALRYTWIYNPAFNYSAEAIVGKGDEDLMAAEDAQRLTDIKVRVLETGVGCREEVKLTTEGRDWYFDLTVEPLRNKMGEVIGVTGAAVDISEWKQAEAERKRLLESERAAHGEAEKVRGQLTTIFETSPVGMAFLDQEQRFVAINEALAEMNGLSREQHLGHSVPELFSASDPELVELFHRLYATGEPFISPQFAINVPARSDRCPGYYNVHYLPMKHQSGQVEGVTAYVVDITERVRLEQAQRFLAEASTVLASSLDYQTTLEQVARLTVPDLADWCTVQIIEEDGSIQPLATAHVDPAKVAWAETLREKYPLNPNDPRGTALSLRTGQSDLLPEIPDELLVQAARDPEHLEILRQVGFKSVMTVALMAQEKILGAIAFVSAESGRRYNQTDLMLAEELARRASLAIDNARLYRSAQRDRAHAEAANRVKDEFLAVLSHELRTPLSPILGWAKLLRTAYSAGVKGRSPQFNPQAIDRALETIERNAQLQTQLIDDLLDVSRILQGKLNLEARPVNLVAPIEAALEIVRLSAEAKAIQIQAVLNQDIGQVWGDASRLQQVLWNLLSNAIKFTPNGGRVEVRLGRVGTQAQIQVIDTGKGITPDFLPYVFDYFRQADSSTTRTFGGLGLGLAIVRHIVELHGGTVKAESLGEGQGATFTVFFNLMPVVLQSHKQQQQTHEALTLTGINVLVVDDDTDTRELVAFMLQQVGAKVTSVASAEEALRALAHSKPDILLSDIGMPDMDGYALMRQIRSLPSEQGGEIRAIALTAYAGEMNQKQALAAGFQLHLPKPIEPEELVQAIANLTSV